MSIFDWSLIDLLSSSIEKCRSIEFIPLTSTDDYIVYCHCEEETFLGLNLQEISSIVNLCYSLIFSSNTPSTDRLNDLSRVLLCYVSECLTCWNIRRKLVQSRCINAQDELNFSQKILQFKPKSEQIFRYRRWLIGQIDRKDFSIENELELCDRTSEKHPINYASWLHRRWLTEYFQLEISEELNRNEIWLRKNLSDSSGFSYRIFLLTKDQQGIDEELKKNEEMLQFYGTRESLWIYRQNLIFTCWKHFQNLFESELLFLQRISSNFFSIRYKNRLNEFFKDKFS